MIQSKLCMLNIYIVCIYYGCFNLNLLANIFRIYSYYMNGLFCCREMEEGSDFDGEQDMGGSCDDERCGFAIHYNINKTIKQ